MTASGRSHWSTYAERWARLGPPLRPNPEVVSAMRHSLDGAEGRTLVLGVTPELSDLGRDVTAVDRSAEMIAGIWPGDTATRRAVQGDWLDLPLPDASFDAVVGDGSLNAVTYPDAVSRLLTEVARVLRPGRRAALRVFRTPDEPETVEQTLALAMAGRIRSFHAFKWHLAMALVAARGDPNLPVTEILAAFDRAAPDREALARGAGWDPADIATIDVYRGSKEIYCFPRAAELLALVPPGLSADWVAAGTYELAARCPLLVLRRAVGPSRIT